MAYEKHNYASGDVLLASELNEMDDAIEALDTNISDLKSVLEQSVNLVIPSWEQGKCYNAPSTVTSILPEDSIVFSTYNCTYVQVNPGDSVILTGSGGSGAKLWVWIKTDGTIISRADSNVTLTNAILTAPNGAGYLLCSAKNTMPYSLIKGGSVDERLDDLKHELDNNYTKFQYVNESDYENKLAKVPFPCTFAVVGNSSWEDTPEDGIAGIFTQIRYSDFLFLQTFYRLGTFKTYYRVVSPTSGTIAYDWRIERVRKTIWYAIGDSITAGSYSENGQGYAVRNAAWSYPNQIASMLGITVYNLGVPGAKITDFASQVSQVNSNATLVTIMGGVNDYGSSSASIGTIDDAAGSGTIIGALKSIISTIANTAPNARIVLIAPIPQKAGSISTKWSINYKRYNFTFEELFNALKAVAEYYNIELVDCMHSGPVNILNIGEVLSDATHPTKIFENTLSDWMMTHLF